MSRPFARSSLFNPPPALFASTITSSVPSSSSSPHPPLPPSPSHPTPASLSAVVDGGLARWRLLGLNLRRSWLVALAQHLQSSSPASVASVDAFTKATYPHVLSSPFQPITRPTLPPSLATAHRTRLPAQHILLVLASANTLTPPSTAAPQHPRRLLKVALTDGWQLLAGLEVRGGVCGLPVGGVAGYKVAVRDVEVWRGVLLLDDSNTVFLGGDVRGGEADEEEARLAGGELVVRDGWDRKGTEEHKQPPPAAPPFPEPPSAIRPATAIVSPAYPPARPPPAIAPYAPPRIHSVPPQPPRFSASLPSSLPPLEHATQYQPALTPSAHHTSPRATDERKAHSETSYAVVDDEMAMEDERMHEFYAADAMDSEDMLIRLSAESDRSSEAPRASHPQLSHSPSPPQPAPAPFVRASSYRAATADGAGTSTSVSAASPSLVQLSSASFSPSSLSAVADARFATATVSSATSAASRTFHTNTLATLHPRHNAPALFASPAQPSVAVPPIIPSLSATSVVSSLASAVPSSVAPRKKKPKPRVDDPFYLPATALSQDDWDEQEGGSEQIATHAEPVMHEQRGSPNEPHEPRPLSAAVLQVNNVAEAPVAMIEHDISGPEELAEAHHYLMQAEEREKQKQASDSLPPLEDVDDFYETKEDTTAVLERRPAVDIIALDDSDDDVLEAPSSGTSGSSPPTLTANSTTTALGPLCTADCPFTYIHSLLRLLPTLSAGPPRHVLLKGCLVTNSNTATCPAFAMQVQVDDGSGSVECAVDGRLLETRVFCCTPQQLLVLSGEEQARVLKEAERRVVMLEGFMVVRVVSGSLPVLLSVHEPDVATVSAVMEQRERECEREQERELSAAGSG